MGQIFGNINDPKARDSGRGSLPTTSTPPSSDTIRPHTDADAQALASVNAPLPPGVSGIGELLRTRRDEFAKCLEAANYVLDLSQRRASDLTLEELTEIWQTL